jgi:hypothetical protein
VVVLLFARVKVPSMFDQTTRPLAVTVCPGRIGVAATLVLIVVGEEAVKPATIRRLTWRAWHTLGRRRNCVLFNRPVDGTLHKLFDLPSQSLLLQLARARYPKSLSLRAANALYDWQGAPAQQPGSSAGLFCSRRHCAFALVAIGPHSG